jgi:CDGSH-type Zn-finger protein
MILIRTGDKKRVKKFPYEVELSNQTQYFWCSCGLSLSQPFCDGMHKGSGKKSLPFEVAVPQTARLCGCKMTKNPPYCDGSHNQIEE